MKNIVLDTNCLISSLSRKGRYFVDYAIVANASYLVSQDHHFDVLHSIDFPKVEVIGLDEFVSLLSYL